MRHATKSGVIIFPNHGNSEVGKGLERKLIKQAEIRRK
jgi:predicted RNA binding protein YcfA (HicA-like mRNA interferase family)